MSNRYQRLIDAQKVLIEEWKLIAPSVDQTQPIWNIPAVDKLVPLTNNLFDLLRAEFGDVASLPDVNIQTKVYALFKNELKIDTLSEKELSNTEDTLIVIAVVRHLLAVERVIINPAKVPSWEDWFVTNYQDIILSDF